MLVRMNARAMLKSMGARVLTLAKDEGTHGYGDGAQPAAPPTTAAGVTAKGVMMDVHSRLGSAMEKIGDDGGVPEDVSGELRALAGLLITIAGEEAAEDAGEASAGTAASDAATPPEQKRLLKLYARKILKADLDPYTAMYTTVCAAREKTYDTMRLFVEDPAKASAALKDVATMLDNAAGMVTTSATPAATPTTAAAPPETKRMIKQNFTPQAFVAWAGTQLNKASAEAAAPANKRLAHLAKAVAVFKEAVGTYPDNAFTGDTQKIIGIDVEIEEAYAGSADGIGIGSASKADLTTAADQKTTEPGEEVVGSDGSFFENLSDIKSVQSGGNNGGTNLPSSNASQDTAFAQNFSKAGAQALGKMTQDLAAIGAVAKSARAQVARREANPWPRDLNTEGFLEPEKLAKRDADAQARDMANSWGKDPWA